jgi:hypothetical protein
MKQKYVSDPFVRISLRPKQEGPLQPRRKSDSFKDQKRTSVRNTAAISCLTSSSLLLFLL